MKKIAFVLCAVLIMTQFLTVFGSAASGIKTFDAAKYAASFVITKETGKTSRGRTYTYMYTYDKNFNLIKVTGKDYDGDSETITYSYDSDGRVKKIIADESGEKTEFTYTYNSKGNVKSSYNSYSSSKASYKYDTNDRLSEIIYDYGTYSKKYSCNYDTKGNLYSITSASDEDDVYNEHYTYDKYGNITKEDYDSGYTGFAYDSKGNVIQEIYVDQYSGYLVERKFQYDSSNRLSKVTRTYDDGFEEWVTTRTFSYGANGKVSAVKEKSTNGETTQCNYKYDSNGNNTKVTIKESNGPTETITRTYKKITNGVCIIDGSEFGRNDAHKYRLSYSSTTYNGKAKKPVVLIDDLIQGSDYWVSYSNNVNPGKGKITITIKGEGKRVITFDIKPSKTTDLKVSSKGKNSVGLKWGKVAGAEKYIVYKYIDKTGKYIRLTEVTTNKATIKKLKANTLYKFCVKAVAKGNVSGAMSAKVKVTTKK